jgi:hypothetical protein
MKYIMKIIQKIIQKDLPTPTGRWKLDYCNTKLNNKIDLSNEDHCGTCGQYAIIKNELRDKNTSIGNNKISNVNIKV